jgi:hypothetical protein
MLTEEQMIRLDGTGYANGDTFSGEAEVRKYFTVENMIHMFGKPDDPMTPEVIAEWQEELNQMADAVIENGWHMEGR